MGVVIRLRPGVGYKLTVTNVATGNAFGSAGNQKIAHKIQFRDESGNVYQGEYVIPAQFQETFRPGHMAVFKVDKIQNGVEEIVPLGEDQDQEKRLLPEALKPVAGESFAVALSLAVTLHSKVMSTDEGISDELINAILKTADTFDNFMFQKQEERYT